MPAKIPKAKSKAEESFALQLRAHKLPHALREFQFHDTRRWRFDFAWPEYMFAVEIEGLTNDGGRHQRLAGFEKDLEKYEAAMMLGWTVYRVSQSMVKSARAVDVTIQMLERLTRWRRNINENTGKTYE